MSTAQHVPDPVPDDAGGRLATVAEIGASAEFHDLRRRFRTFIFPLTALFLLWYFLYVLLAAFAPDLMAIRLGETTITIGLLLGLGQFVSTFAITMGYRRWADRRFDPAARTLRDRLETSS